VVATGAATGYLRRWHGERGRSHEVGVTEPEDDVGARGVLPEYSTGAYYMHDPGRHAEDAAFKAAQFLRLFAAVAKARDWVVRSYADIGCGSGAVAEAVLSGLRASGQPVEQAFGYDLFPGVEAIRPGSNVRFVRGDFGSSGDFVDLVTLFDVLEHVPEPVDFLRDVGSRCDYLGLHLPLDNNLNHSIRDRYAAKLMNPGHLIFLDAPQALSLLAMAGLRVVRYAYTPGFEAPSGARSRLARLLRLPRKALYELSPWLLSKTLGGCSLMALAETQTGWKRRRGDRSSCDPRGAPLSYARQREARSQARIGEPACSRDNGHDTIARQPASPCSPWSRLRS
jgi:SAM-dependent methyltransferase